MSPAAILETVLYAADLDAARAFYRDVMGLPVYSEVPGRHLFFRLERGMLLQADPTVGYALGRGPRSRLTFRDLRVESPYNTYRHVGLPPGPICSPGEKAIIAVMTATPGAKDLYFVARGEGRHLFAATYEEHLANIAWAKARQASLAAAAAAESTGLDLNAADSLDRPEPARAGLPVIAVTPVIPVIPVTPVHLPGGHAALRDSAGRR